MPEIDREPGQWIVIGTIRLLVKKVGETRVRIGIEAEEKVVREELLKPKGDEDE